MSKELSPVVIEVAAGLTPGAKLEAETRQISYDQEVVDAVFGKLLPEHLKLEDAKTIQGAMLDFAAGLTLATGQISQAGMEADKDLDSVSTKVKIGHSQFESSYDRKRSGTAMGKPWAKYGVASTDVVLGTGRAVSNYKNVVAHLGEKAAAVFAN